MVSSLLQMFELFTQPTGNVIYHLVLVFSIMSALQSSIFHLRASGFPQALRSIFGLSFLLSAQIALFVLNALGKEEVIALGLFLPPVDRALTLFGLVWMIWLWVFPEPSSPADTATALVSLLIAGAYALSLLTFSASPANSFNTTNLDWYWQIASMMIAGLGIFLLLIRRPNGWGNGMAIFVIALFGHILHVTFGRTEGDFPGAVRLAYMAAYPILMTLPQRFPAPSQAKQVQQTKQIIEREDGEPRRYSTDPKTFHALLELAAESSVDKVSQAITRAIAQTMLADLVFLIYLTDNNNQIQIASGYDLIREENLEGGSLNKSLIPMLTNAIQRGRPLRLPSSSTSADIKGLGDMLGLANPGHLMSVPIRTPDKQTIGGVLVLSPYSNRLWSAEDQAFMGNIASSLVPIIQRGQRVGVLEKNMEQAKQTVTTAKARIDDLEKRNKELLKQIESVKGEAQKGQALADNLVEMTNIQQESQIAIEKLKAENEQLRALKEIELGTGGQVETELHNAHEEIARLQSQLAQANIRRVQTAIGNTLPPETPQSSEQAEVVASISQELRQPMSSIVGYTELLLGESVGILGALQRKFVERIKASTERIDNLINDLIQITTLETGLSDLNPESVDLNAIIDNALSYTSGQVREKNISMHLEIPKNLEAIYADREALQQILIHLLQNAGAASPNEGSIHLRVHTQAEDGREYVLIQVTDSGGGIPSEDMPRVFTRLYRAENVLIQGVGDTGVGLSIAKSLTEAQHGRIWVETETGKGSTFSVLLPIATDRSFSEN